MRNTPIVFYVRQFPQKTDSSRSGRLPMFFSIDKMLYKTKHKETQRKQKINQCTSKKYLLKATMSQLHEDYYGFAKTGFEKRPQQIHTNTWHFRPFGATWSIWAAILAPIGFWRGSHNRPFLKKIFKTWENGGPRNGVEKTWFVDRCLM